MCQISSLYTHTRACTHTQRHTHLKYKMQMSRIKHLDIICYNDCLYFGSKEDQFAVKYTFSLNNQNAIVI